MSRSSEPETALGGGEKPGEETETRQKKRQLREREGHCRGPDKGKRERGAVEVAGQLDLVDHVAVCNRGGLMNIFLSGQKVLRRRKGDGLRFRRDKWEEEKSE